MCNNVYIGGEKAPGVAHQDSQNRHQAALFYLKYNNNNNINNKSATNNINKH